MIGQYLKIWNLRAQKNLNIKKIIFKVVQMKFSAMHITNQTIKFVYIYGRKCTKYLWHTRKIDHFDPYILFLSLYFSFFDPGLM